MRPSPATLLATASVSAIALLGSPWSAGAVSTTGPSVTLVGHGWGHGRGMGQWGAYGYAVDQGWTSSMILDHYYGGTTSAAIGAPSISVRLSSLDDRTGTWITSAKDFTVGTLRIAAGSAARIVKSKTGWSAYATYGGCSAPSSYGPYAVSAPVVKLVGQSGTTAADTLVTCANGRGYRGQLSLASDGSMLRLVNTLPLEEYLRSVVPNEPARLVGGRPPGLGWPSPAGPSGGRPFLRLVGEPLGLRQDV